MELVFSVHGYSCDLALHPISERTVELIREHGADVYSMKPLNWWRKGKTATWGMRIDDWCTIKVTVDKEPVAFDAGLVTESPLRVRRRMFLDSKAKYLCVLGFDNEVCSFSWKWNNIRAYDPSLFSFMVHQWDRIMGEPDYFILDEMRYDNAFADLHNWCDPAGFTLVSPRIIDLDQVREELERGGAEHAGPPFPSPSDEAQQVSG
ncbi:hypothetical protein [Salidesulfovibrio onnuriiensis]|uniref:hypothetical protein n=1 Tax=Salidesulfovibrio onnuriiensis TaxID=2583823 RepID=UPI0011CC3D0F|nr:hypothetical protein [Salidesulfovibrio onnuriiensis]